MESSRVNQNSPTIRRSSFLRMIMSRRLEENYSDTNNDDLDDSSDSDETSKNNSK